VKPPGENLGYRDRPYRSAFGVCFQISGARRSAGANWRSIPKPPQLIAMSERLPRVAAPSGGLSESAIRGRGGTFQFNRIGSSLRVSAHASQMLDGCDDVGNNFAFLVPV